MNDDIPFFVIVASIIVGVFMLAWGLTIFDCKTYGDSTGRTVKMEYGTCYVKTDKGWFSKDQLRAVE